MIMQGDFARVTRRRTKADVASLDSEEGDVLQAPVLDSRARCSEQLCHLCKAVTPQ